MGGLQISCDFCKEPVTKPGGLLFTPVAGQPGIDLKEHLCLSCAQKVAGILDFSLPGSGGAGLYISEPINSTWHVHNKKLTESELKKLREELAYR